MRKAFLIFLMSLLSVPFTLAGNLSSLVGAASGSSASSASSGTVKRIFVTSTDYNGNLGGLAGANAKCQARAEAAGLSGEWKALVDTGSGYSLRKQISYNTLVVVNLANQMLWTRTGVANWNNNIQMEEMPWKSDYRYTSETQYRFTLASVGYNEFGVQTNKQVWSGASTDGFSNATQTCSDWTDGTSAVSAQTGNSAGGGYYTNSQANQWLGYGLQTCNLLRGLYCIEQ